MKDRPGVDAVAPSSSNTVSSLRARVRLGLSHFWKIFAVTSLVAGLCVGYRAVSSGLAPSKHGSHESIQTDAPNEDEGVSRGHGYRFQLIRDLIDKQSQPATIVFKNQSPAALGYLASI